MHVIEFSPPMEGIDGEFNTFRLGMAWFKRLVRGEEVLLIDRKQFCVIGRATVTDIQTGPLREMSYQHGSHNHNQKHLPPDGAGERVIAAMIKRYGPNKCCDSSKVTVIYMKRTE